MTAEEQTVKSLTGSPFDVIEMEMSINVSETAQVYVFHHEPFKKELSWIEFDLGRRDLNFVFDDGDIKNAGVKIRPDLSAYMQNAYHVNLALIENEEVIDTFERPLIIHRD